jgi:hypothetical protein
LLLAACEGDPTPLPAVQPTRTPTHTPSVADGPIGDGTADGTTAALGTPIPRDAVRYGVDTRLAPFTPSDVLVVGDAALTLDAQAEIVVTLGTADGWQPAPLAFNVALAFNPAAPPLDVAPLRAAIAQAFDPRTTAAEINIAGVTFARPSAVDYTALRNELAALGYPAGLSLRMGVYHLSDSAPLVNALARARISASPAPLPAPQIGRWPLVVFVWTTAAEKQAWIEQVGAANVIDLYSVPVSFNSVAGLTISFAENGFPLAAR